MAKKKTKIDSVFLITFLLITILGLLCFFSASLGVLARSEEKFYGVIVSQLVFGLVLGTGALIAGYKVPYLFWRKYAFYIFLGALCSMLLVFIPGLGFTHGGARRWISLGFVSFQPVEFLKIGFIIYFAAWISWVKKKVQDFRFGTLPLLIILGVAAILLFLQPDTKSFILMLVVGFTMLFVSGMPWKYIFILLFAGGIVFTTLAFTTPYIQERIQTFLHPSHDTSGSSYQLQQSLIAFGRGGLTGAGFGKSVQKFGYLPEPQGDSIFAVIGEEFGFVGTFFFIALYVAFGLRGLRVAYYAPDQFSQLLTLGGITLIISQSFLNIASLVGLFPLTGVPLVFVSQGGTSLLFSFFLVGIIMQISTLQRKSV